MPFRPAQRAFSAAELLVCTSVLIPILLVLLGIFPFAYGTDRKAAELIDAQQIAKDHIERLRAQSFEDLMSYSHSETRGNIQLEVQVRVLDFPPGQAIVRQKRADLKISWRTKLGPGRYEISTYLQHWAP